MDFRQLAVAINQLIIKRMKGQILSRIQSYQNIPSCNNPNRMCNMSSKIINAPKLKCSSNLTKQSPIQTLKIISPPKVKTHRFLLPQTNSATKKLNTTLNKDVKRSLNFDIAVLRKNSETSNNKLDNKDSEKSRTSKNVSIHLHSEFENEANFHNTKSAPKDPDSDFKYPKLIHNIIKAKQLKDSKNFGIGRKQLMRIYSKLDLNKQKMGIGSEQNIRTVQLHEQNTRDPQTHHTKLSSMMKTVNVFNKPSPYLTFHKKFTIKSPHKKAPTKSLSRMPTMGIDKGDDVSIEISGDERVREIQEEGPNYQENQSDMEFGCSEIKERSIDNDSSFLEGVQKNILSEMDNQDSKKKKWKKLPSDFLRL